MFDLSGKTALITGSSRGIGRAIATAMAGQGARVVTSSRKEEACEEAAASIRAAGGEALAIPCHVGDKAQLEALVEKTRSAFGGIDILVNNVGTNPVLGPLQQLSDEAFDRVMTSNVRSALWLSQLVLPEMAARKDGAVIFLSSIAAQRASAGINAYGAAKAALGQLARGLAAEWGRTISASIASRPVSSRPISRALCGRTRRGRRHASPRRRWVAWASRRTLPARRCCSPRVKAASSPARPSSSMAA
jgi:dehydrogenase/reductase SDR family protein 4